MPSYIKLCECGCGQPTKIAKYSDASKGWVAGQGIHYASGHYRSEKRPIPPKSPNEDACYIPLTKGKFALVDVADFEWLNQHKWSARFDNRTKKSYAQRSMMLGNGQQRTVQMHREILGIDDPRVEIDHANGNGLINTRDNLRVATHSQNQQNQGPKRGSKSGFKGVSFHRSSNRWQAEIKANGERRYLGIFATAEDAARAYDNVARELHGEFAFLNFNQESD